jgi:hypothetical protein
VITIFGTTYFTIGAGLVVLVLAAPFLFWLARWLWRPNVEDKPRRVRLLAIGGTTLGLLALLAVGLFWDVYLIGQRAKELCQETGLVVYRTTSATSFLGDVNIAYWSQYGFDFVEYRTDGKILKVSIQGETPRKEWTAAPASQFELASLATAPGSEPSRVVSQHSRHHVARVIDRYTGEVLGQLSEYSFRPGWFDRSAISITGFAFVPWRCGRTIDGTIAWGHQGDRLNEHDLIKAVINPLR